jgi:hypothetical protein
LEDQLECRYRNFLRNFCEFEQFRFLGNYEAIYRLDRQTVEVAVQFNPAASRAGGFNKLLEERIRDGSEFRTIKKTVTIEGIMGSTNYRATFGPPSESFAASVSLLAGACF